MCNIQRAQQFQAWNASCMLRKAKGYRWTLEALSYIHPSKTTLVLFSYRNVSTPFPPASPTALRITSTKGHNPGGDENGGFDKFRLVTALLTARTEIRMTANACNLSQTLRAVELGNISRPRQCSLVCNAGWCLSSLCTWNCWTGHWNLRHLFNPSDEK